MSNTYTEEEINEAFNEALEKGELSDVMGNKIEEKDLVTYDVGITRNIPFDAAINSLKRLQGEVLTVIDASIEEKRAKYIKDVIKGYFAHTGEFYLGFIVGSGESK